MSRDDGKRGPEETGGEARIRRVRQGQERSEAGPRRRDLGSTSAPQLLVCKVGLTGLRPEGQQVKCVFRLVRVMMVSGVVPPASQGLSRAPGLVDKKGFAALSTIPLVRFLPPLTRGSPRRRPGPPGSLSSLPSASPGEWSPSPHPPCCLMCPGAGRRGAREGGQGEANLKVRAGKWGAAEPPGATFA